MRTRSRAAFWHRVAASSVSGPLGTRPGSSTGSTRMLLMARPGRITSATSLSSTSRLGALERIGDRLVARCRGHPITSLPGRELHRRDGRGGRQGLRRVPPVGGGPRCPRSKAVLDLGGRKSRLGHADACRQSVAGVSLTRALRDSRGGSGRQSQSTAAGDVSGLTASSGKRSTCVTGRQSPRRKGADGGWYRFLAPSAALVQRGRH